MSQKTCLLLKSFTLVEVVTASAIFGIICIATTMLLISAQKSWNRQIAQIKMIEADAWGLQRLTAEMRGSRQATVGNGRGSNNMNGVDFDIDTNGDNVMDATVWYWSQLPGCASGNGGNTFYRGMAAINTNSNFCPAASNTNPAGGLFSSATFNGSAGGGLIAVTINSNGHYRNDNFIVSNSVDDLNFSLRTNVRARNN